MSGVRSMVGALSGLALSSALVFLPSAPSLADTGDQPDATQLVAGLAASPDTEAAFAALTPAEQAVVLEAAQVDHVTTTSDEAEQAAQARAMAVAGCYNYTARSAFYNSFGQTLGTMWTTGQICYNGSKVTSAKFVDGGGATQFIGWSYAGRTSASAAVSGGGGYAYGAYTFRFALVAGFQEPIYCARVVGTSVAGHGDTRCGIG